MSRHLTAGLWARKGANELQCRSKGQGMSKACPRQGNSGQLKIELRVWADYGRKSYLSRCILGMDSQARRVHYRLQFWANPEQGDVDCKLNIYRQIGQINDKIAMVCWDRQPCQQG